MLYLHHAHWHFLFGAVALGLSVGWLTYHRPLKRWFDRPTHIAIGGSAIGVMMLAMSTMAPLGFERLLTIGITLAAFYGGGCLFGWALRDLADCMPASATPAMTATAAATSSYLFRDAFAGRGASTAYVRMPAATGTVARERLVLRTDAIAQAPVPGGYTFPKTLPFAAAETSERAQFDTGMRPHWSWQNKVGPTD